MDLTVRDDRLRRMLRRAAATRPMSWLYARVLHHVDRRVYRLTGGRTTFAAWAAGIPVVMLTTTGARSGARRTLPVLAMPDGNDLVVIASNYGQARHPAWYHNLRAHPRAAVAVDGLTREVEAVELAGAERERFFERAMGIYVGFAGYRRWAGRAGREIPVVRLRAVQDG